MKTHASYTHVVKWTHPNTKRLGYPHATESIIHMGDALSCAKIADSYNEQYQSDEYSVEVYDPEKASMWPTAVSQEFLNKLRKRG